MAKKNVTGILISFLKECHAHIDGFDAVVQEHENYVEELYLEVLNKIKNPEEGGSFLPKTPAPKKQGRARKKRVTDDHHEETEGQAENRGNDGSDEVQALPRRGRAASKAAVLKIKESQRQLNDLSSKMRRPDNSTTDVANPMRRSNNRDSGVYDCQSSKPVPLVSVQTPQPHPRSEVKEVTAQERKASPPAAVESRSSAAQDRKRRSSSVPRPVLSKARRTSESPEELVNESPALAAGNESQASQTTPKLEVESEKRRSSRSLPTCKKSPRGSGSLEQVGNNSIAQMVVESSLPSNNNNKSNISHHEYSVKDNKTSPSDHDDVPYCNDKSLPDVGDELVIESTDVSVSRASQDSGVTSASNKTEAPREMTPDFRAPLAKAPSPPVMRTTRTKTRRLNNATSQAAINEEQQTGVPAPHQEECDPNNSKHTKTKKRLAECPSQTNDSDDSTLSMKNNKKRKIQTSSSNEELNKLIFDAVSDSEDDVVDSRRKSRPSKTSTGSVNSEYLERQDCPATEQHQPSVLTSEKQPSKDEPKSSYPSPTEQSKYKRIAVVSLSPLSRSVLAASGSPQESTESKKSCNEDSQVDTSVIACSDVSVQDARDDSVRVEEQSASDHTSENESQEENEDEEEEPQEVVLQPPRRITRSKVRQQQEKKLEEAEQLKQQLARAAAARQHLMSSKQPVLTSKADATGVPSSGKFSPRPFGNRIGVKQLAAAYSEHMAAAASPLPRHINRGSPASSTRTPLASERKRLLGRSSSTSRVASSTSRMTPLSVNRMRTNLASSSDSHHHRAKLGSRPRNLVCGVKSFLGGSVQVQQAARPTREQVEEQRQLELIKKREKEEETLRKKEEQIKAKRNETKRRNEERMRKVQEARQAAERRAAERKAAEAREAAEREKKLKEQRLKEEAIRKKQLMKKAEEEKRKRDEEQMRKEEEARKRREEAEERRRVLLEQQEEERRRLEEARIQEEERLKLAAKREAERVAREKEELRLLKEREAARAAAKSSKPPVFKPAMGLKTLNQTYDANSTYTLPGNSTFVVPASNTPKTPHTTNNKTSTSSKDSYDLTPALRNEHDYGIDDLKSDDSSDDDCNPKKKIPLWATRDAMRIAVIKQECHPPNLDVIFPLQQLMPMLQLEKIFTKKSSFKVRSSSAHWTTPPHKIFSNVV